MDVPGARQAAWKKVLFHPWGAMGVGLIAFPIAKAMWVPNYVFNFLTTLVHEIGHSLCAWLMGMPSIPSVGLAGGGVAMTLDKQYIAICIVVLVILGLLAWRFRKRIPLMALMIGIMGFYSLLAFTGGRYILITAGGILLETVGAGACVYVVFGKALEWPIERPLYALWGLWMLLNRLGETILMLTSEAYWNEQAIIDSGLGAGLVHDLHKMCELTSLPHNLILGGVLVLCVLAIPGGWVAAFLRRKYLESLP